MSAGDDHGPTGGFTVDVWSDVMCPFCYMGDALLTQALEQFGRPVEVRYHSFLLMPDLTSDVPVSVDELLSTKHGIPREQAAAMNEQVAARGRELGLDYRFDRAAAVTTRKAHELSHHAAGHGRQREMIQRLFRAYFTDGLNIADPQVLGDLAAETGLDREAALAALASGEHADAVEEDRRQAQEIGVTGVPFFVFAGRYAVSGAQPLEVFVQALQTSWDETRAAGAQARS